MLIQGSRVLDNKHTPHSSKAIKYRLQVVSLSEYVGKVFLVFDYAGFDEISLRIGKPNASILARKRMGKERIEGCCCEIH